MLLNKKNSFGGLFVLFLGLVSCSKDKEIVYQTQAVSVERIGVLDSQNKMQKVEDIQSLDLGGSLMIDLMASPDFSKQPMLVRVQSKCESDVPTDGLDNDKYFPNQFTIPFLQILSKNALLTAKQQFLRCNFVITVIDQNTSASTVFNMESKVFTNISEFSNLPLFDIDKKSYAYEQVKLLPLPKGAEYTLHCFDFHRVLNTEEVIHLESLLNLNELDVSNWRTSQQDCRMMISNQEQIFISKPFVLAFQPQPLIVDAILHLLPKGITPLLPRQTLTLRLLNPNNYGVQLRMQNLNGSRFLFQPVYIGTSPVGHLGTLRDLPLVWSFEQKTRLQSADENQWTFNLPAKQEIEFYAHYNVQMDCGYARELPKTSILRNLRRLLRPVFVGIKFGFDLQTQFLLQIDDENWLESSIKAQNLAPLNTDPSPFWDLHYLEVRSFYTDYFPHPAQNNEEFINSIRYDIPYDACRFY
jgi:hypothetical protein